MATSKAQLMAVKKYRQEKRDQISFDVPKGKREELKRSAALLGMTLQGLFVNSAEEFIKNHAGKDFLATLPTPETKSLSPADERLLDEFSKLPADAKKHLVELAKIINQKGGVQND